ncbi:hypothetical protein HYFRA_00008823 [Hymenoscyphus fraxineus]|uniref:Uncharacterized protein n=1 Tax=Hymenoscyphus fraxineus TaxID=746836 RepID=A0A9N9PJL3_9HELO|nr:hypothetical protein HYFRA_00008823 [Hymenoscyphus fraxineus]
MAMFHRRPQKAPSEVQNGPSTAELPLATPGKTRKMPSYLSSICHKYLTVSTRTLNKLVCLCGGRDAKYMLDRVYTLKHFQSLPDPAANLCDKCKDTRLWANAVGGKVFGERENIVSNVKPWNVPNFGITYRYRNGPNCPSSSPAGSPETIYYCEHRKSPDENEAGGESTEDLLRKKHKDNNAVLVRLEAPPKPRYTPPSPPEVPERAPATEYTKSNRYERSTGKGIFGPRRLNAHTVVPFTANGRPVFKLDESMLEKELRRPFPNRHVRVRFDPRTSEPLEGALPDPGVEPTVEVPEFETIPVEGVLPYKIVLQFSQYWDPAKYILFSMDQYDPGFVWLRKYGLSREAALRPPPQPPQLTRRPRWQDSNYNRWLASGGEIIPNYGPEDVKHRGYLHPYKLPKFPPPRPSKNKKQICAKPQVKRSRSAPQHDLTPIVEIPEQETNTCDASIATQAENIRQARKKAAGRKNSQGTRRVSTEDQIPVVAATENTAVKRSSTSAPPTDLTEEEVARQAAGARPVVDKVSEDQVTQRVKPDLAVGGTSNTLKNEVTPPKSYTSMLSAGLQEEAMKAHDTQEGNPDTLRFSQQPTLRQSIAKQPQYTFASQSQVESRLPKGSAKGKERCMNPEIPENMQNLENLHNPNNLDNMRRLQQLQHFQHLEALRNLENPNNSEAFHNFNEMDHNNNEWEDYTGENSPVEEEFDPSWFLERASGPSQIAA